MDVVYFENFVYFLSIFPQARRSWHIFYAFFHSSGLWAPQDRATKTNCRRLGRQVVFFKLKNTLWGHFFEAPVLLDFRAPRPSDPLELPEP